MSYTEYLSRKKAAAAVILDTRPKMDASTYTRHTRVVAAANVYVPTKSVVGNINDMRTSVGRDNNAVKAGVQVTLATGQGGRVPDGSTFSDVVAGRAAEMDYKDGPPLGKVTLNSNDEGSLSGCSLIAAPVASKNASSNTKDIIACRELQGEPHTDPLTPVQKGITHFVDDHISLNSAAFRIGTGSFGSTGSTVGSSNSVTGGCPPAIHTISAITPRAAWAPRPTKGAGGLFVSSIASPEHPYKAGALVPSDHLKYVEKHHGNDFNVDPRRYPKTPFQIPAGTPDHLKINNPNRVI